MHYRLICFDLDGTLVETAPEILDAVNDTLEQFDLPGVEQSQVERWIGHGTHELLVQALAHASGVELQAVRAMPRLFAIGQAFDGHYARRCGTRSRLYPSVRETLYELREHGVRLAVVTNKESRYTQRVLSQHGLDTCFDRVVSGDTLPTKKPDPRGIEDCMRAFAVPPGRTLFVGDSSIDAATARRAGVAVWLLPYGYNMGQPIEACAPDRIIPSLASITDAVSSSSCS